MVVVDVVVSLPVEGVVVALAVVEDIAAKLAVSSSSANGYDVLKSSFSLVCKGSSEEKFYLENICKSSC